MQRKKVLDLRCSPTLLPPEMLRGRVTEVVAIELNPQYACSDDSAFWRLAQPILVELLESPGVGYRFSTE